MRIDDYPVDYVREKIDMRIFFGYDLYGDYQAENLFANSLVVVASSDFIRRFGSELRNLPDRYLIHTHWGSGFASSPNWEKFLLSGKTINRSLGMSVNSRSTALNFVRNVFGATLIPAKMALDDISLRRIMLLETEPSELPRGFRIAYLKKLRSHLTIVHLLHALSH